MENLDYILQELMKEKPEYTAFSPPDDKETKRRLVRMMLNARPVKPVSQTFIRALDKELTLQLQEKGIIDSNQLPACTTDRRLKLWQGNITRLKADAIVNAANSALLGCFHPGHHCIDNAIHSAAGIQLREECHRIMQKQGHPEPTGTAQITNGYNLPVSYVIHTVGPIIHEKVTEKEEAELSACYTSSLTLACEKGLHSLAFCCISTGEYRFPGEQAAGIAIRTVQNYLNEHSATTLQSIIFNVFKDNDYRFYHQLLY